MLVSGWIVWEAIGRLDDPPELLGGWMLLFAAIGLVVNAAAAGILIRSGGDGLNVRRRSATSWPISSAPPASSSRRWSS